VDRPERGRGAKAPKRAGRRTMGWREWVALPDFGVRAVKAKLDTGARTSTLHAFKPRRFKRDGLDMVRFEVHPVQRSSASKVVVEAEVKGERNVRTSSGQEETRLVVETTLSLAGARWPIELTLSRRDAMGFRMLLGRRALAGRIVVDPAASFLAGEEQPGRPGAGRKATRTRSDEEKEEE
jgi:hypothetical protein